MHTIDARCIRTTRDTASTFNPGTYRGEGTLHVSPKDLDFFETTLRHNLFSLVAFRSFFRRILEKFGLRRLPDMASR